MSGLLDRINSAAQGDGQRGDVAPIVAAHQASIPVAYVSQSVLPDPAALAAFMEQQMGSAGGLLMYRQP